MGRKKRVIRERELGLRKTPQGRQRPVKVDQTFATKNESTEVTSATNGETIVATNNELAPLEVS